MCLSIVEHDTGEQPTTGTTEEGAMNTLISSPLVAADRCDRCGAQAYVRVTLLSGSELLFCAHHARRFEPTLREQAAEIHDESGRLAETPAAAPLDER
jgi:hypothetical protein